MKRILILCAMLALATVIGSCGSDSGGGTPTDPAGAIAEAQLGDEALASGDYASANQHYRSALAKDPSNTHANFGAAISEVFLVSEDPEVVEVAQLAGGVDLPPGFPARAPGNERVGFSRTRETLRRVGLDASLGGDPMKYGRLAAKLFMMGTSDPIMASDVQAVIKNNVLPPLQYVEDRLQVIESHPEFVFLVTPAMSGEADTLEIDLGEIYALDGMVNAIQGWLHLIVAYNFDVPDGARADSVLAPGTDFGTLHPGGALDLQASRLNMLLSHTRIESMVAYMQNETDPQDDDLIPQAVLDDQDFIDFLAGFDDLENALNNPVAIDIYDYQGSQTAIVVQIGNFFTNSIADLKTKMPDHTFSLDGMDVIVSDPVTFPDPTFNNIFPGMTNGDWQAIIGPVGPGV